uniref:Uncharacterized protein n=1 Tax=Oryzias latipes TaxID=8090 RepID=A0A3P9L1Q0_ORYLA
TYTLLHTHMFLWHFSNDGGHLLRTFFFSNRSVQRFLPSIRDKKKGSKNKPFCQKMLFSTPGMRWLQKYNHSPNQKRLKKKNYLRH